MPGQNLIYAFGGKKTEGSQKLVDLLGSKGAGLAQMSRLGAPVPPGFTIATPACNMFYKNKMKILPKLWKDITQAIHKLEKQTKKGFGNPQNPLLVSVRSGAKASMPGMMDTILNVGLNDTTVEGLATATNNPRFAYDCYRRLITMFGSVVMGVPREKFEHTLEEVKKQKGVQHETQLDVEDMKLVVEKMKQIYKTHTGEDFPQDPYLQIRKAIEAVFKSWNNPRAVAYRKIYNIPDTLGTAVNIQTMVFGNFGEDSATGVGFTRDPATGEKRFYGEFLLNAQGEDVVAGIRTPLPIENLSEKLPAPYKELRKITSLLERHYKDVQDFEFTIERGKLFMLQTRSGKRTGIAALKIAVDMVKEKLLKPHEAIMRVEPYHLNQLLHPIFDPVARKEFKVVATGLNASPGAASGRVVFSPDKAVKLASAKERVILVRAETSADDIHGIAASKGVLTAVGGYTSHAAVVTRQLGKPGVVGCSKLRIDEEKGRMFIADAEVKEGEYISIDGTTGEIMIGDVPLKDSEILQVVRGELEPEKSQIYQYYQTFMQWVDRYRKLGVRANADTPRDAEMALKLGAEGIGLCRTEHMFFAPDRIGIMQEMIMAKTLEERKNALDKLLPLQREDFVKLFQIMEGYPVIIRTLDPPLHEFLPRREELIEKITLLKAKGGDGQLQELEKMLRQVERLHEFNPMMGWRGCRLGVTYPEITRMQAQAIFEAAAIIIKQGKKIIPEIMIPVVAHVNEIRHQRKVIDEVAQEVMRKEQVKIKYLVGTMIEIPRAALTAGEIAKEAEFFSFGTNDLTQMTYGFSRDDTVKFMAPYIEQGILSDDPFLTVDQTGVGELMKIAVERGRKTRKGLECGICGEHGGDPASIIFCHKIGLDYVSCSPYRIPVARLVAAQAAISHRQIERS